MTPRRVHLAPTGFGDGEALGGGPVRFGALRLLLDDADHVVPFAALAATIAPLPADTRARIIRQRDRLVAPRAPIAGMSFDRPRIMGILNVTPDSFSDGGRHADPVAAARAMIAAGADIVDVGGESTRPRAPDVPLAEELARVEPVLAGLHGAGVAVSIDTRKGEVMRRALAAGAVLVNDVSALTHDLQALGVVVARRAPVVLMHAQGTPQTMQDAPVYDDVLRDVFDWLEARIDACVAAGMPRANLVVDPGIGFGKTVAHNLALLRGIGLFHALGCPVLLGVSRKKMIGTLSDDAPVDDRLPGSLALALHGLSRGVQIVRVHDVAATVQAVRLWHAVGLQDTCGRREDE